MKTERFGYRILVEWDDEDQVYVARVPALRGCLAHGDTPARAVHEVQAAAEAMLHVLREDGDPVPPADVAASYSGNIRLRLPATLHRRLDELAGAEGVSLNTLMVSVLSEGLGRREARGGASGQPGMPSASPAEVRRGRVAVGPGPVPRAAEHEVPYGGDAPPAKPGKSSSRKLK